jgi:hypothetical protein
MNEQIEQWIPWYVNGTLGANERAEMDRYLATNQEARAEVALFAKAAAAMKASAERVPADIGLQSVLARIQADKIAKNVAASSATTKPTLAKAPAANAKRGFLQSLTGWLSASWAQPALVAALAVIGVQSFMLFGGGKDEMQMRGNTPTPAATSATPGKAAIDSAYLRVMFKATATEGEIRVLLGGNGAHFASGPGESGEYLVVVPSKDAMRTLDTFKKSNVIASVNSSAAPKAAQ